MTLQEICDNAARLRAEVLANTGDHPADLVQLMELTEYQMQRLDVAAILRYE